MIPHGTIHEILSHKGSNVWTVTPDTMVFDAIKLMAEKNIGALAVVENSRLTGMFTERDYTRKVALKGRSSRELKVRDIFSPNIARVTPNESVEDCMRLMTEHRVRHLPVVKGNELSGIVSIGDLVNWIISAQTTTISQLETYISGIPS
ncbi:MAG TPA: CBS domain-containing protein [Verrucomicrobiae bacterium]|jgi:CBS domain-containing protein|nr:CBS domain-containing protein [Verrucomicrobiae bacterium]